MKDAFTDKYNALDPTKKWKLRDNVYVEDKIYEFGMTCAYEQ